MKKLSVVLAVRNEEENIGKCLESVKSIADEIIVMDEGSTDKTRDIAKKMGVKVYKVKHEPIFHKTKQKALVKAMGDWILQLDADERVSDALGKEIRKVIELGDKEIKERMRSRSKSKKYSLFMRHQKLIEQREGSIGKKNRPVVAFFIPRVNYFLGKPLKHAGVYPDGVIRLIKKGKGRFPAKTVHEQIDVDGEVAWLFNELQHHDSPSFEKYLTRMNRYTDLQAQELRNSKVAKNPIYLIYYSFLKPAFVFLNLYFRHLGFLDGMRGFIWSLFSSLHYPIAYFKYWQTRKA